MTYSQVEYLQWAESWHRWAGGSSRRQTWSLDGYRERALPKITSTQKSLGRLFPWESRLSLPFRVILLDRLLYLCLISKKNRYGLGHLRPTEPHWLRLVEHLTLSLYRQWIYAHTCPHPVFTADTDEVSVSPGIRKNCWGRHLGEIVGKTVCQSDWRRDAVIFPWDLQKATWKVQWFLTNCQNLWGGSDAVIAFFSHLTQSISTPPILTILTIKNHQIFFGYFKWLLFHCI